MTRSDEYTILPEKKGEIVQRDGNNVTDTHLKADRKCQIERTELREKADEAPVEGVKSYVDGLTIGAFVGALLVLIL